MTKKLPTLNRYSARITQEPAQASARAMLYATGLTRDDLNKAQVGIASMWWDGNPCNMHLLDLAGAVADGVLEAGLIPMRFNTIGVSDGISMGTEGMSYSLPSRDLASSASSLSRPSLRLSSSCIRFQYVLTCAGPKVPEKSVKVAC